MNIEYEVNLNHFQLPRTVVSQTVGTKVSTVITC
jgi:hypothetical protein